MVISCPASLPMSHYIRPIRRENGGQQAYTHLAEVLDPSGVPCRGYVKHFPDTLHRSLFNEYFGHALMGAMGVPQPRCAVMPAPVFGHPEGLVAWAFVSFQPRPVSEGTPKELYDLQDAGALESVKKRLFDCPALPLLIAADQLAINPDRNLGNLVFTGRKTFVAIDHAGILGGPAWTQDELTRPTIWALSKLIEKLESIETLKPRMRSAFLASAQVVEDNFYEVQAELRAALNCESDDAARLAMDAVWWRSLDVARWFKNRLQLLA